MLVRQGETMPDLFLDPAFARSKHWRLSTSQMSSESYSCWGWGEVVPDGFGLPYSISESSIYVAVSSRMGQPITEHMSEAIAESLRDIKNLVEANKTTAVKSKL